MFEQELIGDDKVEFECYHDYDWKDADSTFATGSINAVVLGGDDEGEDGEPKPENDATVLEALERLERKLLGYFGNKYVVLTAEKVNGQKVPERGIVRAAVEFLKENPGTRCFEVDGRMG